MAGVRGKRSIWPRPPKSPTGMFGQPQKMDSTANMPHKASQSYAKLSSTRTQPNRPDSASKRHQPHKRIY